MRTLLVLACALAGCGGSDEPAAPPALSAPITYEVIGGDAFRDDEITVAPDGTASVETRAGTRTAHLTAAERESLAHDVSGAGLTELDDALADPPVPDGLSHRFTYRGHQVTADTGELPDELRPLIGTFDELIERYGAR
jgi:hypothetical protein